jgi:segregation and condensation protein B
MTRRSTTGSSASKRTNDSPPLELDHLSEPDDGGLSLNELSQAYAALLAKGTDPYPERPQADQKAHDPIVLEEGPSPADDDTACELTPRSILEAILFVGHPAAEPLTSERIAALMRGVQPREIDDLVNELNEQYEADGAPYTILSVGPGYQMSLRPQFTALREAFYGRIREARLSQAAIDILAIVAYHQPISGEEIERQRGKPSAHIVAQLVRRDLLCVQRLPEKGGKSQYRTTDRFLDLFGLEELGQLPRSQDLER